MWNIPLQLGLFEQKGKEAEIEMMYFEKFEKILTPRQLFKLRAAERHFTGRVLRHHGRLRLLPIGTAEVGLLEIPGDEIRET